MMYRCPAIDLLSYTFVYILSLYVLCLKKKMNNCSYLFYQPYQHFSDNFTIIGNATVY